MPADPIGEIPIIISGDTSELEKDLRTAEEIAKAAGQKISDALSAGSLGSDQLDESLKALTASGLSVNQAMIQVAAGIKDAGEAAGVAAPKVVETGVALESVSKSAVQASSSFEIFGQGVSDFIVNPLQASNAAARGFVEALGPVGVASLAAAAGVTALGSEIVNLVLAEGKATESTQNFADRLQLSFQDTQKLSEMADIAGISVTVLERASARLATAFEDSDGAGKKVAAALDNMGIVADGTGQTLVKLLEHLASLPTASERMAEATAVMGRGAIQLEPLLKNYASLQEAVESLGGHITDEMVSKLLAADDASDKLGITWGHLKQNLAATFAPAVTIGLENLVKLLSGAPEPRLQTQIDDLISEINRLKLSADQASVAVTSMMGGGFTSVPATTGLIAQKEALLSYLQAQKDAIARSKEYNDAIDASNRAAELWAQGAKQRAVEVKAAFSTLGLLDLATEVGKVTAAFDLLKGKLSDNSVIASTEKLFDLLNTAFKEGAISEAQFTSETERLGQIMDAAITRVDAIKNSVKQFGDSFNNDSFRIGNELMKDLGTAALETRTDFVSFEMAAEELGTAIEALGSSKGLPSVKLALAELHTSLKDLGTDRAAIAQFNATLADAPTLDTAELAWSRVSGIIDRIGKNDLPLAIAEYQKFIGFLEQHNAAVGTIYNSEAKLLQLEINEKTLRGESATAEIIALENIRLKTEALTFSSQALGKVYVGLIKDFEDAFQALGKGIADNIVDGKNWGDVWQSIIKQVEKSILETLIGSAMKALEIELLKLTGLTDGLGGALTKLGGILGSVKSGSGEVLKEGSKLPGGTTEGAGSGSGEGGDSGSGGGILGSLSSLGSIAGVVSAIAGVGSGIAQGIQMAQLLSDTGKIEVNTRQCKELLLSGVVPPLLQYLPELKHLVDIWGEIQRTNDILLSGAVGGSGGGGNTVTIVENGPASGAGNGPTATPSQNITLANPPDVSGTVVSVPAATTPFNSAIGQITQGLQSSITGGPIVLPGGLPAYTGPNNLNGTPIQTVLAGRSFGPLQGSGHALDLLAMRSGFFQSLFRFGENSSGPFQHLNGPSATVAVYALDPTAQGVANAITKSLQNNGIKTR